MNWMLFWDVLNKVSIVAGLAALLVSISIRWYLRRKERRDHDLINVRLRVAEDAVLSMQGHIRRKDLTRAEVLGMLGMLPMRETGKRFELTALSSKAFFDDLEAAQVNPKVNEVVIPCSVAELAQFDREDLQLVCIVTGTLPETTDDATDADTLQPPANLA
ncbi:MAG: hypothetical protein ACPG51_20725 [Thiolinea sp.]